LSCRGFAAAKEPLSFVYLHLKPAGVFLAVDRDVETATAGGEYPFKRDLPLSPQFLNEITEVEGWAVSPDGQCSCFSVRPVIPE